MPDGNNYTHVHYNKDRTALTRAPESFFPYPFGGAHIATAATVGLPVGNPERGPHGMSMADGHTRTLRKHGSGRLLRRHPDYSRVENYDTKPDLPLSRDTPSNMPERHVRQLATVCIAALCTTYTPWRPRRFSTIAHYRRTQVTAEPSGPAVVRAALVCPGVGY